MPLRLVAFLLVMAGTALSGRALAEDVGRGTIQITANYGVYFVGLHFGDVRLVITVRNFGYEMKGDGRFSLLASLIYEWRGATTSAGKLDKSGPKPSLYTLSYSGGNKEGDVRVAFADGAVSKVSMSPTKRPNPRDIPVTKDQLRGVLDPMTGAFLRARPNLSEGDLKVCDETIPVFDGQIRFDLVLMPKQQRRVESATSNGYSGLAAVCGVKFVPISGSRPDNPAIKIHVFAYRFDRGLARAFAVNCPVRTLPNFATNGLRVRLRGIAFVPGGQRRSKRSLEQTINRAVRIRGGFISLIATSQTAR